MPRANLRELLGQRILVLDGAMGTLLQQAELTRQDFGDEQYEGCNEVLNITRPDIVERAHRLYLQAGADLIETNTFGGSSIVLAEYGLAARARELNQVAAQIARQAADQMSTLARPRFVLGSMGPTTKSLSLRTGDVTFTDLVAAYQEQAEALLMGGVDALLIETAQDTLNIKAAGIGISQAFRSTSSTVPIMISATVEPMGTTLAGQTVEALYLSLEHLQPVSIGINCATGPELMTAHIQTLSQIAQCAVSCHPNAGLPDETGCYHETPKAFAEKMRVLAEKGWLNIAGGCCGTTPEHIRALAQALDGVLPRRPPAKPRTSALSGLEPLWLDPGHRPYLVGERNNVIGSKLFRELVEQEEFDEAADIARMQVSKGAQLIDICLANPSRDELADLENFLPHAANRVRVPLMIDSTNPAVMEAGLRRTQGKGVLNSINLEDGMHRFERGAALAREYGAAVVVGTIDEQGMALTKERKQEVARRSYRILVDEFGLPPQDIIFDPLVFPVGTGDATYRMAAAETVAALRQFKREFPQCPTILGISNVSFGLPPAGREVLNSVFLYHCTQAGLDLAIVNPEKLRRYPSISQDERELAEAVLFSGDEDAITSFTIHFRNKSASEPPRPKVTISAKERLAQKVTEGTKIGLSEVLEELLQHLTPIQIVNGPLLEGMAQVGLLFDAQQLIVAEVLQSAEVMKAAVSYLEPYMGKDEVSTRGTLLLATVKGDVHDIGKNLVNVIFSNNGYKVVDLGTKVGPEELIAACRQHHPDIIGLSGLLVKSTQQMASTAEALQLAGIAIPLLVGGAALTRGFTERHIAARYGGEVIYAKDAMDGLRSANRIMLADQEQRGTPEPEVDVDVVQGALPQAPDQAKPTTTISARLSAADHRHSRADTPVDPTTPYLPADTERHLLRNYPLEQLQPYINWQRLLGKHMGIRGNIADLINSGDRQTTELMQAAQNLLRELSKKQRIQATGIYQFFPACGQGNEILIYAPNDDSQVISRFHMPRQRQEPHLCLADFLRDAGHPGTDYLGMFVLTTGHGVASLAKEWTQAGQYVRSHLIQALALELAEAFAERIHEIMRDVWGLPRSEDRLHQPSKHQGIRVSFGYPTCPDLTAQRQLFDLLHPEDIGVALTDSCMMEPEASVSALVFAHPQARYFSV